MAKQLTVSILIRDKTGRGPPDKESERSFQCTVNKGELVVEIPEDERETKPEKGTLAANYRLYSNPEIIFYARHADVTPLEDNQLFYLLAVQPPIARLQEYLRGEEKMELVIGDGVMCRLSLHHECFVNGLIRYIGPLSEQEGYYFGIEILEKQYRGKGTSNGRPHFNCGPNNAVYVAMDKIVKKSENTHISADQSAPKWTSLNPASKGGPVHNTRAQANDETSSHQSQFKVGDRVVLQSVKGDTITGTVRWVGPVKVSKLAGVSSIPIIGVETDYKINPNEHFPDLNFTPSSSNMFRILHNHSRVFLPEQLVVHAETYVEHQEKENAEAKLAKEYGLSLEEYRSQKEWLDKAKLHRDTDRDRRHAPDPPIGGKANEKKSVAGGGTLTDNPLLDSVALVQSGQHLSKEKIEQQRQIMEQIQSQRQVMKKSHEDIPTADYQGRDGAHDDSNQHTPSNLDAIREGEKRKNYSPRAAPRSTNRSPRAAHYPLNDTESGGHTSLPSYSNTPPLQFAVGSMVSIPSQRGPPLRGVVQWIGTVPDFPDTIAGVELEEPLTGCTDGTWQGRRFFNCPPGRAFFCPVTALKQNTKFIDEGQIPANLRDDLKNPLDNVPTVEEYDTIVTPELFTKYIGDGPHGIQGHHNSCYLDSTVFGLFALSDSFDELLLEEPQEEVGRQVKYYLWKGIVNPLRKYGLARHESVMSLRNSLEEFGQMKGATTDEKNPEEFLNLLFKEVLHVEPFLSIKRPFGVEKEYFIQLFFEIDPKETQIPKTDKLLVQMFREQNISFTSVPSKLLLQKPHFKDFKMYNKIIPSLTIDVKPLLDPSSRGSQQCYVCLTEIATHACYNCPKEIAHTDDPYLFYCTDCNERAHRKRKGHRIEKVKVQAGTSDVNQMSKLQLLSVICIETSHYVCYTRSGDRWLFHDSMADRKHDMYNIPKVVDVTQELQDWVYSEKGTEKLMTSPAKNVPEYVRRFTQDIYMCVYVNTDLDMYGAAPSLPVGVTGGAYQGERYLPDNDCRGVNPYQVDQERARQEGGDGHYPFEERRYNERDQGPHGMNRDRFDQHYYEESHPHGRGVHSGIGGGGNYEGQGGSGYNNYDNSSYV